MKRQALKIIIVTVVAATLLNILAACNKSSTKSLSDENYTKIIAQLNSKISELESMNGSLYGDYENKISALRSEVEKLSQNLQQNTTTTTTTQEVTTVAPADIIPFEYKIENNQITLTKYTGDYETVVIPSSIENTPVTKIGESAFEDTGVVSVTIPSTITLIDWFAFRGCYRLTDIRIPESVIKINYGAFDGAKKVKIHCKDGSYAEKYAISCAVQYLLMD